MCPLKYFAVKVKEKLHNFLWSALYMFHCLCSVLPSKNVLLGTVIHLVHMTNCFVWPKNIHIDWTTCITTKWSTLITKIKIKKSKFFVLWATIILAVNQKKKPPKQAYQVTLVHKIALNVSTLTDSLGVMRTTSFTITPYLSAFKDKKSSERKQTREKKDTYYM